MMNPLLNPSIIYHQFDYKDILPQHFIEAFEYLMPEVKKEHEYFVNEASLDYFSLFENNQKEELLGTVRTLLDNFNYMVQTPEIRQIYDEYIPKLSMFFQEMALDERAYFKIKSYQETENYQNLTELKQKMVKDILFAYERGGINLPLEDKNQLQEISFKQSEITSQFNNNLKDTEAGFEYTFTKEQLKGLPDRAFNNTQKIVDNGIEQFIVSYSSGVYSDIMSYCENEDTRKIIYEQLLSLGVKDGYDNRPLLKNIVDLENKSAKILGYKNYAEYFLVKKMATSPSEVLSFINDLGEKSLPTAKKEAKEVEAFGYQLLQRPITFHDRAFVIENMQKTLFSIDSEEQRKYFPVNKVLNGLFSLVDELYDIEFVEIPEASVWHEDVLAYYVKDKLTQDIIGSLYLDLYKRKFKSSGAWMYPVSSRHVSQYGTKLPVVYLVCNAPKDVGQEPTFEFNEIITLFHEMGHALHNLLTEIDQDFYSGLNQVEHDAIELPSQFMENFCWDYEILKKLSSHTETGKELPLEEYHKMLAMKNFLSASAMVRQVSYSEIDMRIYNENDSDPMTIENEVFNKWKTREIDSRSSFIPTFSHIFSGGYGAGYYAYKWAEVLSADAFHALKEAGNTYLEQKEVAHSFRKNILAKGGSSKMAENFFTFRGRTPDVKYLLIDCGIDIHSSIELPV